MSLLRMYAGISRIANNVEPNSVPDSANSGRENCSTTKTRCCQGLPPARFFAVINKFGVTFHLGILLTGSPQDPYTLACWPHSPHCLPALKHLVTQLAFLLTLNPFFAWHTHPLCADVLSTLERLVSVALFHAANPQNKNITGVGVLGAQDPETVCIPTRLTATRLLSSLLCH